MLDSPSDPMATILVVCTGNVCRSPMAEGFLRSSLDGRFGDDAPLVASAGTAGWEGSPAMDESVQAAAEREVDISGHVARRLLKRHVEAADLVLCMAAEHREAIERSVPEAAGRTFTLKELVRLVEALDPIDATPSPRGMPERISAAGDLRRSGFEGNPYDEDVADPLGLPVDSFRAVAWELDELCRRLADGLYGRAPASASLWEEDE